jgi:uncharacterized protein YndB with AHSA1/START domain
MASVEYVINTTPEQVFAVLADGWTYSDWVVGTAHIRDVDAQYPQPGTAVHHKAGPWPVSLRDSSKVLAMEPDRKLTLQVRLWPLGEATVEMELVPVGTNATEVSMFEEFRAGPLQGIQNKINDVLLHQRNVEALRRLADLAMRKKAT